MERVEQYRIISKQIIREVGQYDAGAEDDIRSQVILDEKTGNYLLLMNGWKGERRFYGILIHIEVTENGRVWVHQDNTDLIIVDKLLEQGIPKKDIILGFHAPIIRPDTDFAVA